MTYCLVCEQSVTDQTVIGCMADKEIGFPDRVHLAAIPFEGDPNEKCNDCHVQNGHPHHAGCPHELCPRCGGWLASCQCKGYPIFQSMTDEKANDILSAHLTAAKGVYDGDPTVEIVPMLHVVSVDPNLGRIYEFGSEAQYRSDVMRSIGHAVAKDRFVFKYIVCIMETWRVYYAKSNLKDIGHTIPYPADHPDRVEHLSITLLTPRRQFFETSVQIVRSPGLSFVDEQFNSNGESPLLNDFYRGYIEEIRGFKND